MVLTKSYFIKHSSSSAFLVKKSITQNSATVDIFTLSYQGEKLFFNRVHSEKETYNIVDEAKTKMLYYTQDKKFGWVSIMSPEVSVISLQKIWQIVRVDNSDTLVYFKTLMYGDSIACVSRPEFNCRLVDYMDITFAKIEAHFILQP